MGIGTEMFYKHLNWYINALDDSSQMDWVQLSKQAIQCQNRTSHISRKRGLLKRKSLPNFIDGEAIIMPHGSRLTEETIEMWGIVDWETRYRQILWRAENLQEYVL